MTQPPEAETEIQGCYYRNATSEAVRVRLSIDASTVSLHTLSGRLMLAGRRIIWKIATIGERWLIGDGRLPEALLVLESDQDYQTVRKMASKLRPVRARLWRRLGLAAIESGNLTGWPVLVLLGGAAMIYWLWQNLPWQYCVATRRDTILLPECLIIDRFMT
jgi:hypothetical protein